MVAAAAENERLARMALLTACSVRRDEPQDDKMSLEEFAAVADADPRDVFGFVLLWDELAQRGLVRPASELVPDDARTYELSEQAIEAVDDVLSVLPSGDSLHRHGGDSER